jgi:hypothetical protein
MVGVLLISTVSAELIINGQPKDMYNIGDTISVPITIKSLTNTQGFFQVNLICSEKEINFYKSWISLNPKNETKINASVQLMQEMVGKSRGACNIEVSLLKESTLTEEFIISNLIEVKASINKNKFNPEEEISIKGNATKESGTKLNGFVEIIFSREGFDEFKQTEIVSDGKFSSRIKIPKTMNAGNYLVLINAYEKDFEEKIINEGSTTNEITISQIPTNLEIFFEKREINPGENLKIKAILHDQTGKNIDSLVVISIKNKNNVILEQVDKQTDSFFEYFIKEQQTPSEWKVIAVSNQITKEENFIIKEKENISIEIINNTIVLKNTGNVIYNKTVFVKIGEEPLNIETYLGVGESKKYYLTAPNGEYQVEIISPEGENVKRSVILTGNVISVKEVSEGAMKLARHPFVWIFILLVLGITLFLLFKKTKRKILFGNFSKKNNNSMHEKERVFSQRNSLVHTTSKTNLLLSLQGTPQPSSVVCIKVKNSQEILSNKNNSKETIQKIVEMAENAKGCIYENNEYLFFLFFPLLTKTFQNEMTTIDLAQSAKKVIDNHNRLFKQNIHYGISVECGDAIAKKTEDSVNFMGLGQFMINARRLSSISQEEVCISEKLKEKIQSNVKLEKRSSERGSYYVVKEIIDKEKNKKFLSSFVKRLEKNKKEIKEDSKEKINKEEDESFDLETF